MSQHPEQAALEAYVLGHHDEIDPPVIERHLESCERCLDEVGREARLEMLLNAAGREDAFAAVVPWRSRRLPLVAGTTVAVAAAAAVALWLARSQGTSTSSRAAPREDAVRTAATADPRPAWARDLPPGTSRCVVEGGGDVACAASAFGATRGDAETAASDIAIESLLDRALLRGGPAIRAQRALYAAARSAALGKPDLEATRRARHQVASHAGLGRRDSWYWEEYEKLDGAGTEFQVFVRFVASANEIDEFLAGYRAGTIDGAELFPIVAGVRWALDPGDDMAWFVHRPGKLAELGIRAGDVLLHDQRRSASAMRALVERDEVRIWRQGLERPVPPSKLR